jgi:hypothetical protein
MMGEQEMGRDLEGGDLSHIKVVSRELSTVTEENDENQPVFLLRFTPETL